MGEGAAHVQHLRRTDSVIYRLEDRSTIGCVYIGQTPIHGEATSSGKWQIQRITFTSDGDYQSTFANSAKFNAVWDDRASYFDVCPPNGAPLPEETITAQTEPVALSGPGVMTPKTVTSGAWVELMVVANAATNRRTFNIQNRGDDDIVLNYSNTALPADSWLVIAGGEKYVDALPAYTIYGRSTGADAKLIIEEITHTS